MNYVYFHCNNHKPKLMNNYDICVNNKDDFEKIIFHNYKTIVDICDRHYYYIHELICSKRITWDYVYNPMHKANYASITNENYISEHKCFHVTTTNTNQLGYLIYDVTTCDKDADPVPMEFLISNEEFLNGIIDGSLIDIYIDRPYRDSGYELWKKYYDDRSVLITRIKELLSNTNYKLIINDYGEKSSTAYFIKVEDPIKTKRALKDSPRLPVGQVAPISQVAPVGPVNPVEPVAPVVPMFFLQKYEYNCCLL